MNVSGGLRSSFSMGLWSRSGAAVVAPSATVSVSRSAFSAEAGGSIVGAELAGESDISEPSNPMLGVGILHRDSCVVNYIPKGTRYGAFVRRSLCNYLPVKAESMRGNRYVNPSEG